MNLKLFPKIALVSVLLATIPAGIVGWQTATLNREQLVNNILELHTNLANSLARRIDAHLDGVTGKLRAFVEALRMQGISSDASFQAFLDSNHEFVLISFLNPSGKEVLKAVNDAYEVDKDLVTRSDDSIFKAYLGQKAASDHFEPQFSFFFGHTDPRLKIIFPYDPSNAGMGSVYVVVSLKELWYEIVREGAGVGGGGRAAFIADKEGRIIVHSNRPLMDKIYRDGPIASDKHPLVAEALQGGSIGSKEFKDDQGQDMVGSYSQVKWTGWVSVIEQPKKIAFAPILQTRRRAVLIVVLAILVAGVAAFYLAKGLSKPIFKLIDAARKVGQNKFDQAVDINSDDELGDLADTFNDMVWALKSYSELQVDRLIEEKTKTESVIFSIADGLIMTDSTGKIQILNQKAVRVFALDAKSDQPSNPWSWVGKNILDVIDDDQVRQVLKKVLAEHGAHAFKEISVSDAQETRHYQLSSESVVNPRTGKDLGVVTVVHDVTLERELDKLKESFLHSITHDLRNPMTSIQGFVKFLLDEKSGAINEMQKSMLLTMERASERFLVMINDILDIAKLEAGKLQIEIKTFPLDPILENLENLYQPLADKRFVKFEVLWNARARPVLMNADENLTERVLGNLFANALKFTPSEGKITVSVEDLPEKIQISVNDTGPGIPDAYREKIFDKFQQLGLGKQKGGTGLGLTICKYFVELHRGRVWVEPGENGKGSKFAFWIPKNLAKTEAGEVVVKAA